MAALADRPLAELLDEIAAQRPAPGAGSSTALTGALAAALVEMAAAFTLARPEHSDRHSRMVELRTRAHELRDAALELADRDLESYTPVLAALGLPADDPSRASRLRGAMSDAATAPLAIAAAAAEVAALAAEVARTGTPHLRGEAVAAAVMAEAACRAAAALVELDLAEAVGDARLARATELARRAADARAEALR